MLWHLNSADICSTVIRSRFSPFQLFSRLTGSFSYQGIGFLHWNRIRHLLFLFHRQPGSLWRATGPTVQIKREKRWRWRWVGRDSNDFHSSWLRTTVDHFQCVMWSEFCVKRSDFRLCEVVLFMIAKVRLTGLTTRSKQLTNMANSRSSGVGFRVLSLSLMSPIVHNVADVRVFQVLPTVSLKGDSRTWILKSKRPQISQSANFTQWKISLVWFSLGKFYRIRNYSFGYSHGSAWLDCFLSLVMIPRARNTDGRAQACFFSPNGHSA